MTFEEYINGLKQVSSNELQVKLYNQKVKSQCDFKVNLGELLSNLAESSKVAPDQAKGGIKIVDWYANRQTREGILGVVSASILYPHPNGGNKPLVETFAKFRVDDKTRFSDGTTLRDNTYYHDDYGRREVKLLPQTHLDDIIVPIDLAEVYMTYPRFLNALIKCNIIEDNYNDTLAK